MADFIFSQSSGIADSVFGKSQEPIRELIERRAEAFEQMSVRKLLYKNVKSDNFAEKFTSMTAMDDFLPVGEGASTPQIGMEEGYSKVVEPVTWKGKFIITQEAVEDNKILSTGKPEQFTVAYMRAMERFACNLLVAAVQQKTALKVNGMSFPTTCADGKIVFAKDHKAMVSGTTQSNLFTNEFNADNLTAVETAMQNLTDDKDNPLNVSPDTIVIPNVGKLKKAVFEAIGADKDPDTANNGANFQFGRWKVIVSQYLNAMVTDTNAEPWILMDSNYNQDYSGAVWLDRVPMKVNSYIDDDTQDNVWSGRARFSAAFNDFRYAALAGISTGSTLS